MAQQFPPGSQILMNQEGAIAHPHPGAPHLSGPGAAAAMVQQMHPGVSGPGGPQVTQAGPMMGGGMPGQVVGSGAPMLNAHAMSHLGSVSQQMFPQQNMTAQNCE